MTGCAGRAIDCREHPVEAALWLARAFADGRCLSVLAPGAPDHAHHVAVEFVHPVVAGTRPLPAVAAPADGTAGTRPLPAAAAPFDETAGAPPMAVVAAPTAEAAAASPDARLVIGAADPDADLVIPRDQSDAAILLSYHLLWELVQVALEHPGLVGSTGAAGGDSTGFLYPFLDAAEDDEVSLREALQSSADAKRAESHRLAQESLDANRAVLDEAGAAIAHAARSGGRVLTMGNGGSATDAARLARMLRAWGVPAESLSSDYAVATALANDLGAERIFARQLDAFARPGDVLAGCSTSGASRNLLAAFDQAAAGGLTTVGLSGYGGGSFAGCPSVHHSLVVQSMSVHRIQEAQAALMTALCERAAEAVSHGEPSARAAR